MKLIHKLFRSVAALLFVLMLGTGISLAQDITADDYFHNGAQSFINNDLQTAINQVNEGIAQYPDDPKLNALLQKLQEEQEKQQQQQQQNQDQQDQQNQDQQQQDQQDQQNQEQNEQEENKPQNGEEEDQNQQQQPEQPQPQPGEPREMSKEDAQKILQALAQKEKELLKEFKKQKPQGSATHEKDW